MPARAPPGTVVKITVKQDTSAGSAPPWTTMRSLGAPACDGDAERPALSHNDNIQRVNAPGRAEAIGDGENRLVSLNTCGEVDTYTFTGQAGQMASVAMVAGDVGTIQPQLALYDSQGLLVARPEGGILSAELPREGTYTLLAFSAAAETGTYRLALGIDGNHQRCDVNGDSMVTVTDGVNVLRAAAGLPSICSQK